MTMLSFKSSIVLLLLLWCNSIDAAMEAVVVDSQVQSSTSEDQCSSADGTCVAPPDLDDSSSPEQLVQKTIDDEEDDIVHDNATAATVDNENDNNDPLEQEWDDDEDQEEDEGWDDEEDEWDDEDEDWEEGQVYYGQSIQDEDYYPDADGGEEYPYEDEIEGDYDTDDYDESFADQERRILEEQQAAYESMSDEERLELERQEYYDAMTDEEREFYDQHMTDHERNSAFQQARAAKLYFEPYTVEQITDELFQLFSDPQHGDELLWYRMPFGVDQQFDSANHDRAMQVLESTKQYMMEEVLVDDSYLEVRDTCRMRNELCVYWAMEGECEANPPFMAIHCAPACKSCEKLDINGRCPWDPEEFPDAWLPPPAEDDEEQHNKTLNAMFERLTTDPWFVEQYKPTILSRDPWAVTLDSFLTEDECEQLIELGTKNGYERSQDVGEEKFDGTPTSVTSTARTSHNTWCGRETGCYDSDVNQAVLERIENVTNIPSHQYEFLQLLRYEEGQYYQQHHDYIPQDARRQIGARILTVFLYLNDVEHGGGTKFPYLGEDGIIVQPKRGRALLWPSVLHDSPNEADGRTEHEAMPVLNGSIKYAANAWVHQRDFVKAFESGCN